MKSEHLRSSCPIACTLDLLGDRWTLLVVRDLLLGKTRYAEFHDSHESIATNILADRLKRLQEAGIIEKRAYQDNPLRFEYALTRQGRDLGSIVSAYIQWGTKHIAGTEVLKKPRSPHRGK